MTEREVCSHALLCAWEVFIADKQTYLYASLKVLEALSCTHPGGGVAGS